MPDGGLSWVIVDGTPRHVSEFAALAPRERPAARCPECGRALTLKLGRVRRHHAAHPPGRACPATRAETALHLACKFALADALRGHAAPDVALRILLSCAGAGSDRCDSVVEREWLRGWDEVHVELRIAAELRPDIVLRLDGRDVGAIEVFATHAVAPAKAAALSTVGVPWIEVVATERLAAPGAWSPVAPLAAARFASEHPWRCARHDAEHRRLAAERDRGLAAEAEARRHARILRAARVVDIYYQGGVRERHIYRVESLLTEGELRSTRLARGGMEVASVAASGVDWRVAWPALRLAFTADVARLARTERSIVDSPMRWATGSMAESIVDEALADRVGRDPTPLATRYPRRWYFAAKRDAWFLPRDMRDVSWNRDESDAFAAHPAWSRARTSVRERPAPPGSWESPVFAAPPLADLFAHRVAGVTEVTRAAGAEREIGIIALGARSPAMRRAVVVLERPASDATIGRLDDELSRAGVEHVWISHPRHWTPALREVAWAPAGRDARGRGGVVVDGLGVFRADQFLRAIAAADPRLSGDELKARLAGRVGRLADSGRAARP